MLNRCDIYRSYVFNGVCACVYMYEMVWSWVWVKYICVNHVDIHRLASLPLNYALQKERRGTEEEEWEKSRKKGRKDLN